MIAGSFDLLIGVLLTGVAGLIVMALFRAADVRTIRELRRGVVRHAASCGFRPVDSVRGPVELRIWGVAGEHRQGHWCFRSHDEAFMDRGEAICIDSRYAQSVFIVDVSPDGVASCLTDDGSLFYFRVIRQEGPTAAHLSVARPVGENS